MAFVCVPFLPILLVLLILLILRFLLIFTTALTTPVTRTEPFRELRRVAVVIGLRSHRRGVCVSGHGTDVLAYARTEDVERETDGM